MQLRGATKMQAPEMEKGESEPLLQQSNSGEAGAAVTLPDEEHFSVPRSSSSWKTPGIILGYKFLEGIAFHAVLGNLVIYLISIFHETNAASATQVSIITGATFLAPFLGAIVADSFLGRYWTVLICATSGLLVRILPSSSERVHLPQSPVLLLPHDHISNKVPPILPTGDDNYYPLSGLAISEASTMQGSPCPMATSTQNLVLSCGLYLMALGVGGAKSSLLPLGAEQFNDGDPVDAERKSSFISSFYVCFILGKLLSTTIIAWVQENVSWGLGFGIGTLSLALGFGGFLIGTPYFGTQKPQGGPLKSAVQVFVSSFRKMNLDVPKDSSLLYETKGVEDHLAGGKVIPKLVHTDSFRFLDRAAIVSDEDMNKGHCVPDEWKLCTVTQVEELKALLRVLPIWISCVIYYSHSQIYVAFIEQGNAMDRKIFGNFYLPAATLQAFQVVCVTCISFLYGKVLVPAIRNYTGDRRGLSLVQRIGVGHAILTVTLAVGAALEAARLESVRRGSPLSIAWQLPLYFLLASTEAMGGIGQMEFFYDQAPDSMKSICSSLFLLSASAGNYLTSLLLWFITLLTAGGDKRRGWLPEDLNDGHLDYVLVIVLALSTLNLGFYLWCARRYSPLRAAAAPESDIRSRSLCTGRVGTSQSPLARANVARV